MGHIEIRLRMDDPRLQSPNMITQLVMEKMLQSGRELTKNDVIEIIDDHDAQIRVLKIANPKTTIIFDTTKKPQ